MSKDDAALKRDMEKAIASLVEHAYAAQIANLTEQVEASRKELEEGRKKLDDLRRRNEGYRPSAVQEARIAEIARILAEPPVESPKPPPPKRGPGQPKGNELVDRDVTRYLIIFLFQTGGKDWPARPELSIRDCIRLAQGTSPHFPERRYIEDLERSVSRGKRKWKEYVRQMDREAYEEAYLEEGTRAIEAWFWEEKRRLRELEELEAAQPPPGTLPS